MILRHGAATYVLASGATRRRFRNGWATRRTAFTMDVYASSVPALEETAAKVSALLADPPLAIR